MNEDTQSARLHKLLDTLIAQGAAGLYPKLDDDFFAPTSGFILVDDFVPVEMDLPTSDEDKEKPSHRIVIETTRSPHIRNFHVNDPLYPATPGLFELDAGETIARLQDRFRSIKGVTHVDVDEYCVNIHIGLAFDWREEVQWQVIKALASFLGWGENVFDDYEVVTAQPPAAVCPDGH